MPECDDKQWRLRWRRWLTSTLNAGTISHSLTNASRRTFIINLFCLVGVIFTFPLGILSLVQGYWLVGAVLLTIASIYAANHWYLRNTKNYLFSANIILYPLYALLLYLVYSGGVNGTGHVWVYCLPPVSLFLHGLKRGLIEVATFLLALIIILFFIKTPFDDLGYHPDLKSRIVYSFILVAFLSTIYEYISSRFNQSLQELSLQLELAATTDPLTGLLNRRGIQQKLDQVGWLTPAVLLVDVDYFKSINDKFGHECGDEYLQSISNVLHEVMPKESLISRWGGEEFLIFLNDQADYLELAEKLRQRLANIELSSEENEKVSTTASIGVTSMKAGEKTTQVINRADKALYEAKRGGRNNVAFV